MRGCGEIGTPGPCCWGSKVRKSLAGPQKVNQLPPEPGALTPRDRPERNENSGPHDSLRGNAHSILQGGQKANAMPTPMFRNRSVWPLGRKRRSEAQDPATRMILEDTLSRSSQTAQDCVSYSPPYIQRPELASLRRQKQMQGCLTLEGRSQGFFLRC